MGLLKELFHNRGILLNLAKNDFKNKFAGSYLGVVWAFVQPIIVVIIYWFVFQVGFKATPMDDYPYVLWLIAGICPWFYFNDAVNNGTNSLMEYSYIVKKVVFKISMLPVVKIVSATFVHVFFIILILLIYLINGVNPTIYWFQTIYYSICVFALSLGITYLTSSVAVFFKDLTQIVNIILQFGMWLTPIMYSAAQMPGKFSVLLRYNPMYYVVEGYRDSIIRGIGFWNHGLMSLYFWIFVLVCFGVGTAIYKKLKPHFADVL